MTCNFDVLLGLVILIPTFALGITTLTQFVSPLPPPKDKDDKAVVGVPTDCGDICPFAPFASINILPKLVPVLL